MTSRDVRLVFTKYDGSLHWHQTMKYLGDDEHGIWLGAEPARPLSGATSRQCASRRRRSS